MIPKRIVLLLVCAGAAATARPKPVPPPPGPPPATARDVTEAQLDSRDPRPAHMSGPEARKIHERYLDSIGRTLESDRISAGSTPR